MRKLTEDKLDEINRVNSLKANIIKWWNVILKKPDQPDNKALYESILKENNRNDDVYKSAMESIREEEEKALEEANKIYERLMREAQMDEEKKLQEIEAVKREASVTENK